MIEARIVALLSDPGCLICNCCSLIPQDQLVVIANDIWAAQSFRLAEFGGARLGQASAWRVALALDAVMPRAPHHLTFRLWDCVRLVNEPEN
jgi:hypothetical protein